MTSQLNVDTIVDKAGSGGSNVKMANTSTYVGEGGSGTQNTVQSLVKAWTNILYTSAAPGIQDSFNASSVADTTTGEYTVTLSNNMANSTYVCVSNQQDFAVEHQSPSLSTSTYAIRLIADSSGARADIGNGTQSYTLITGDLA